MALASSVSQEARSAIEKLVKDVQSNKLSLEEAQIQAERINPGLGRLFNISSWSDEAKAALYGSVLIACATLAVAAATLSAPSMAPPANIVVQVVPPPASPDLKNRLLSSVFSQPTVISKPTMHHEEKRHRDPQAGAKPRAKSYPGKKRPDRPR